MTDCYLEAAEGDSAIDEQSISWYLKKASFKQLDASTLAIMYCNKFCGTFNQQNI